MKKNYSVFTFLIMSAASVCVQAQQIANSDFEGEWVDCIPYTYLQGEGTDGNTLSPHKVGTQPQGWAISNVAGMASVQASLGATTVGEKVDGRNSAAAVKLTNTPNPFLAAQKVPGYINLGTAWSTAMPAFGAGGITINNSDGGAFGGQGFTGRPTALEFWYKRSRGEDQPNEKTTIVAYLWKGHWTQKDVPVSIVMVGEPKKVDMIDRDRCVLGMDMTGCQGGEVEKTPDAELIAVINVDITEDAAEWTKFHANFDYKSDATPEMINIVIASGDYFGGASVVGKDNSLTVDDVQLVYAGGTSGIDGVEADSNAPAEYYNLSGVKVNAEAMAPGLYICRQGAKTTKILIK